MISKEENFRIESTICPLCGSDGAVTVPTSDGKLYYRCGTCELTFIDGVELPLEEEEKARYLTHENSPESEGYCNFLSRIIPPLTEVFPPPGSGLDFGCGTSPVLVGLLEKQGYRMNSYDPFFKNDRTLLDQYYDFITSTEVFEHLHTPKKELELLLSLLPQGGVLAVMTNFLYEEIDFNSWYYRRDNTHVSFYTEQTFSWIAEHYHCTLSFCSDNIAILKKN